MKNKPNKRRKKNKTMNRLISSILLLTVVWFVGRGLVGLVKDAMIKTDIIQDEVIEEIHETKAYIFRDEEAIASPATGKVEVIVGEGSRVRLNSPIFNITSAEGSSMEGQKKTAVPATKSGIVYYQLDGLEGIFDEEDIANLDIEELDKLKKKTIDNRENNWAEQGSNYCKIVNNLGEIYVYVEYQLSEFEEPLQKGDKMTIRFKGLGMEMDGRITQLYGVGDEAKVLLKLDGHDDRLMNIRSQEVEIVISSETVMLIDKNLIVTHPEEGAGVYIVYKGEVRFKPITVLGDSGKQYKVEGLDVNTEIVTTPKLVEEGDRIY